MNNSSPQWDRSRPEGTPPEPTGQNAPSEPYADLFAALDRADVSEAVRAAFAHALNPPPPSPAEPTGYADSLVARHLSGRESIAHGRYRGPADGNDPRSRYTLHLTFPAGSLSAARIAAAVYAEALLVLRPELWGTSPALLSRADRWNLLEPITCGRAGPEGETCARTADHLGCHRDSTTGGLCWGDNEPTGERPDTGVGPDEPTGCW
jgi:hypothetical protein